MMYLDSLQFSNLMVSNSLRPHGLQHTRLPCPSPTPGACSNSCPLSRWCHPNISFSVILSPPAFNLSQTQGIFQWLSSTYQVAKVLEFQLQHQCFQWIFKLISFRIDWFISLQSKRLSRVFSNTTVQKHQLFSTQLSLWSNSHIHAWLQEKP